MGAVRSWIRIPKSSVRTFPTEEVIQVEVDRANENELFWATSVWMEAWKGHTAFNGRKEFEWMRTGSTGLLEAVR